MRVKCQDWKNDMKCPRVRWQPATSIEKEDVMPFIYCSGKPCTLWFDDNKPSLNELLIQAIKEEMVTANTRKRSTLKKQITSLERMGRKTC